MERIDESGWLQMRLEFEGGATSPPERRGERTKMTGNEFKTARKSRLKLSQAELAIVMQTPKRTIQDIEALGDQEVRGVYAACIELLIWKDQVVMQAVIEKVDQEIARNHPAGIRSERESE